MEDWIFNRWKMDSLKNLRGNVLEIGLRTGKN